MISIQKLPVENEEFLKKSSYVSILPNIRHIHKTIGIKGFQI